MVNPNPACQVEKSATGLYFSKKAFESRLLGSWLVLNRFEG